MKKQAILSLLFLLWMRLDSFSQCAMCKAAAASKDETGQLAVGAGLNAGVLFLLTLPFIGVGVIAWYWVKNKKALENSGEH